MKHIGKVLGQQLPAMEGEDAAAFLKDFAVSADSDKPITSGLFRLEAGKPMTYTYTYHEMKLIVDGKFEIADETGQKVTATAGDLFYFPKGSTITFTTPSFGVGFFCGQRGEGEA
jgi:ethanolamine utilization protein EutQ (cupin superfamily)